MTAPWRPANLRSDEWVLSKASVLLGFADLTLIATREDPTWSTAETVVSFALFVLALIGVAGLGYVVNDLADESADRRAGVTRPVVELRRREQVALLGALILTAVAPWFALDPSGLTLSLLTVEILLLLTYPLPPIRLKERGSLALLGDAGYGYVIPIALTMSTFSAAGDATLPVITVIAALAWGMTIGLRSIAQHQLEDVARDRAAGTTTWATMRDSALVERFIGRLWVLEAVAFVGLTACAAMLAPAIAVVLIVGALWQLCQVHALRILSQPVRMPDDVINPLVTHWFPLALAGALIVRHPGLWPIAALQMTLTWRWLADLPDGGIHRTRVGVSFAVARISGASRQQAIQRSVAVAGSPTHVDVARRACRALRRWPGA